MKLLKRFRFVIILLPLAIFISFLDKKIISGFLATNQIPDHYLFIGSLIVVISVLIFTVLRFDKNINP
jgi:drug/metabolite transporter (DMT)-like permease